jgi:O-antigen ligase
MDFFAETGRFNYPTVVHATFGNSNYVGSYFSIMVPLAIVMYLRSNNNTKSIWLLTYSVASFAGLVVSSSRISWISVIVSVVIGVICIDKNRIFFKRLIILIIILLSVILFIALVGVGPDCLYYYGAVSDEDLKKHPFLRVGIFDKAHSDPIEFAASMGIPALIFYACFIGSILFPWFQKPHNASPELSGIFAAWLGYLIQSLFNVATIGIVSIFIVFSAIIDKEINQ